MRQTQSFTGLCYPTILVLAWLAILFSLLPLAAFPVVDVPRGLISRTNDSDTEVPAQRPGPSEEDDEDSETQKVNVFRQQIRLRKKSPIRHSCLLWVFLQVHGHTVNTGHPVRLLTPSTSGHHVLLRC